MFGLGKKKKPKTVIDDLIGSMYGESRHTNQADVTEAVRLASEELLMGNFENVLVRQIAEDLAAGPMPYSTHDLALSVAMNFFKRPEYRDVLFEAQLMTRMKMLQWHNEGLVLPLMVQSFENILYETYK